MMVAQLIGIDIFLDSFEKSYFYLYLKDGGRSMKPNTKKEDYRLLQKSGHQQYYMYSSTQIYET